MSVSSSLRRRWQLLRDRARADHRRPARVWVRRQWPWLLALVVAIAGTATLDAWLATCGFNGCPTSADIRAFRAPEGGRILDRAGRFVARITMVRRVNVPIAKVSRYHRRRPKTSPFSAAKTPIWQVKEEAISTVVIGTASARLRCTGSGGQLSPA